MNTKKEAAKAAAKSSETCGKDTSRITQMQIFYEFLRENVGTCSMVSDVTGLKQKCCCRYKRELEKNGYLFEIYYGKCKSTGLKAAYLTTNRELMPKPPQQLELFPL